MKKIKISFKLFRSFQFKVTLALILSMLFVGALSSFLVYQFALNSQFNQLRDKLQMVAQTASLMIDADMLMQVPLSREGINSVEYKTIAEKLNMIRRANPPIRYIYTMKKTSQPGILQFIVDPDPVGGVQKRRSLTAYPGDIYNATRFPDLLRSFAAPTADKKLLVDEWGAALSGYAPIKDKNGQTVAILGIDIISGDVYLAQKEVRKRANFVLLFGILFSIVIGTIVSKKITKPIEKLVEGTRRISIGDLKFQVDVADGDEISELGRSFNKMSDSLYESRRRIHSYFYSVIQSFARIVEARDHYTRGHSERVAEYSEKIALQMGFSDEQAELLKETAILHDIGKFGIQESVLNKKEPLTEEEWALIRQHPSIGEDILRPVLIQKEMLEIVRQHHERFDGKGYPEGVSADKINIFAQILSVADAYDAMTSQRAYRNAFSKKEAMEELEKNSGTQFNPKVTEAFLQILKQEK